MNGFFLTDSPTGSFLTGPLKAIVYFFCSSEMWSYIIATSVILPDLPFASDNTRGKGYMRLVKPDMITQPDYYFQSTPAAEIYIHLV